MSNYNHDHDYEASLGINIPDGLWETHDPLLCLGANEPPFFIQADIDSYNELSDFVQQHDVVMGNDGLESEACPESFRDRSMTELYCGGCDYGISQADALPYPSSTSPYDPGETETTSHEELSITLKEFTSTINQLGVFSQTLGKKVDGLNSRFDDMGHRLDSMEHRMDSMKYTMDNLSHGTEDLEAKFKTVNEYLLEVIRQERIVMQEFGDLASQYHEREM